MQYAKSYEADLIRKNMRIPNYRYADEREWRFVPQANDLIKPWCSKEQYNTNNKKSEANLTLEMKGSISMPTTLYLIVKKETEIRETINHIRAVKRKTYEPVDIGRLTTKIVSCERIFSDF